MDFDFQSIFCESAAAPPTSALTSQEPHPPLTSQSPTYPLYPLLLQSLELVAIYIRAVRSGAAGAARAAPLFVAKFCHYSKSS